MQDVNTETESRTLQKTKQALVLLLIFTVLCAGLLAIFMRDHTSRENTPGPADPHQTYLEILAETHTGLRLVRLRNYVNNAAPNEDIAGAKAAMDVLGTHEQTAWAKLTDTLYDLDNSPAQKEHALTAYKMTWGVWSRPQDMPRLLQATMPISGTPEASSYAPDTRQSRFRKGDQNSILAGAAPTSVSVQPPPDTPRTSPIAKTVQNVRIKYAKRPHYPRRARRKGIPAVVTLALDIDERGHVARTRVVSINARRYRNSFIRAARRAAMASRFHPKTIAGKPVASSGYLRQYTFDTGS